MYGIHRCADTDGKLRALSLRAQSLANPHRGTLCGLLAGLGQYHRELIASIARSGIDGAAMHAQDFGQPAEGAAPGLMTMVVVDGLEAVKVQQHHREASAGTAGAFDL